MASFTAVSAMALAGVPPLCRKQNFSRRRSCQIVNATCRINEWLRNPVSPFKACNQHKNVVIGSGLILQQVLSDGDRGLPKDVELAFKICSRLQAIRKNHKNRSRVNWYAFDPNSLLLALPCPEHKR